MEVMCPLGLALFGAPEYRRCPALEPDGTGKYACGLVVNPSAYALRQSLLYGTERMSKAASHLIGADFGCDALLDGEASDEAFRDRMRAQRNPALTDTCLRVWGFQRGRA